MTISHKNLSGAQIHEPKDIAAAAIGQTYIADGAGSGTWTAPTAAFSERFESGLLTITPAGPLTVAHGLTGTPNDWSIFLENVTPEFGYTAGQRIKPEYVIAGANNQGVSIVADATNLLVEYGSGSGGGVPVFQVINRTTNVSVGITNANWNLVLVALKV